MFYLLALHYAGLPMSKHPYILNPPLVIMHQKAKVCHILSHTKTAPKNSKEPYIYKKSPGLYSKISRFGEYLRLLRRVLHKHTRKTHTHTHTHTHLYIVYLTLLWQVLKDDNSESAHKHAHTFSYTHTHAHTHTHIQYIHTHIYTHTHTLTHTYNIHFHVAITGAEVRECVAVCCSVSQCVAVCCSVIVGFTFSRCNDRCSRTTRARGYSSCALRSKRDHLQTCLSLFLQKSPVNRIFLATRVYSGAFFKNCLYYWKQFKILDWGSMCSNPCESELTCFRPELNRGPCGLLNFLSAALSTTELWWRMTHRKSFRTLW